MKIVRTNGSDNDFSQLVAESDALYRNMFGSGMDFFEQFNKVETAKYAVVVYEDDMPIACGCFREFDDHTVEIKRMYVLPSRRNKGIAGVVLHELEAWAKEIGYSNSTLETSISLAAAIGLYKKNGYQQCDNWGQYIGIETSMCMRKNL